MSAHRATAGVGGAIAVISVIAGVFVHVMPSLLWGGLVVVLAAAVAIGLVGAAAQKRARLVRPVGVMAMAMLGALSMLAIDFALDYRAWRAHAAERAAEMLALQSMGLGTTPDIQQRFEQALADRDLGSFVDAHPTTVAQIAINGTLACAVAGFIIHHKARA